MFSCLVERMQCSVYSGIWFCIPNTKLPRAWLELTLSPLPSFCKNVWSWHLPSQASLCLSSLLLGSWADRPPEMSQGETPRREEKVKDLTWEAAEDSGDRPGDLLSHDGARSWNSFSLWLPMFCALPTTFLPVLPLRYCDAASFFVPIPSHCFIPPLVFIPGKWDMGLDCEVLLRINQ